MKKILTGALAALTLGGVVLGGASEASARGWGPGPGATVAAGIAGLAIGAAIASNQPAYGPAPVYYAAPPPAYYAGPAYTTATTAIAARNGAGAPAGATTSASAPAFDLAY